MSLGVTGSTDPVRCGARPLRAHRDERGRGTVVGRWACISSIDPSPSSVWQMACAETRSKL